MNKILIILSFVVLASCAPNEIPSRDLVERNGIKYEINSQTPFTGVSTEYYLDTIIKNEFEDRVLLQRTTFKKGIKNGFYESFHLNGQLKVKENFKDGYRDGLLEEYGENGQLIRRNNYKNGNFHGVQERFSESGVLEELKNYKNEKLHGVQDSYLEGRLQFRSYWTDGELDGDPELYDETGSLISHDFLSDVVLPPPLEEILE